MSSVPADAANRASSAGNTDGVAVRSNGVAHEGAPARGNGPVREIEAKSPVQAGGAVVNGTSSAAVHGVGGAVLGGLSGVSTSGSHEAASARGGSAGARRRSVLSRLFGAQESGLVLVIAALVIALAVFGGTKNKRVQDAATGEWTTTQVNKFLDTSNLVLVAKDASFIAIMAVGMTAVIITAGIDLSIGSIYGLAAIVGALVLSRMGAEAAWFVSVPAGLLICMGVGALCGAANGAMIVGLRVHPFVITLGMLAALRGLTIVIPKELSGTQSVGGFPASFTSGFFKAEIAGVYPVPAILMLGVTLLGWFVLSRTVFGRRIYAVGGNETAARYAGIPVGRVLILVYALTGMLAGLSACVYLGYLGAAETSAGSAYELRVIAATVIGGASLMGGRGTAIGAMLGAVLVELINNGMIILGVDQDYNQIVMGAAIVVAVVIDQSKSRLRGRGR